MDMDLTETSTPLARLLRTLARPLTLGVVAHQQQQESSAPHSNSAELALELAPYPPVSKLRHGPDHHPFTSAFQAHHPIPRPQSTTTASAAASELHERGSPANLQHAAYQRRRSRSLSPASFTSNGSGSSSSGGGGANSFVDRKTDGKPDTDDLNHPSQPRRPNRPKLRKRADSELVWRQFWD